MEFSNVSAGECGTQSLDKSPPRVVGYARVSTDRQAHVSQMLALHDHGLTEEQIVVETASGAEGQARPQRDQLLGELEPGDTLIIWNLDRLGRSMVEIVNIVDDLHRRGITLKSLTQDLDTGTTMGRMLISIFASFAQMERERISERTRAGLAAARSTGRVLGRPSALTSRQERMVLEMTQEGATARQIQDELGAMGVTVSTKTIYRARRDQGDHQMEVAA
ncbi:recombinase family protein [Candidatus Corynebacterium faecigallinarum]|uniref:recombinase family protein n=1 Tax=Candidatus Corynebacterium faecigallinarum TaxID=2838528 RepID=UPI003FCF66CC